MSLLSHKLLPATLLLWIVLLLSACADDTKKEAQEVPVAPMPEVTKTPESVTPKESDRIHAVTDETRKTYQWYCAQCHGVKGKGDGINAKFLPVPPRDHTKADYLETRTDEHLFTAIKEGGLSVGRAPCMPRWGQTLDDPTIHSLVSYIRELCDCEAM